MSLLRLIWCPWPGLLACVSDDGANMRILGLLLPVLLLASTSALADRLSTGSLPLTGKDGLTADPVANQELERQRALFLKAWEQLSRRSPVNVGQVVSQLDDYPLAPYLHWQDLRQRLRTADRRDVNAFLERHPDLPVSALLRSQWLHQLGRDQQWQDFLAADRGQQNVSLRCYRLQALRAREGVDQDWVEQARDLWMVGHSQPNACDPVFKVLYDNNLLNPQQRWTRIERIMEANNPDLAQALRSRLDADQRGWLDHWVAVHANPAARLQNVSFDLKDARGQRILESGLLRLAARDRPAATRLLNQYAASGRMDAAVEHAVRRSIALRSAWSRDDNALALLEALPDEAVNDQVLEWRARLALVRQDWQRLMSAVWALPLSEQGKSEWRYWKAEALRQTGQPESATVLLEDLARERHYYGFLAADRLGLPYAMNHSPTRVDGDVLAALQQRPGVRRAREFQVLKLDLESRREWFSGLGSMDPDDMAHAAVLALQLGWYDRAIITANRAGLHDDLDLRFPMAMADKFRRHAGEQGVDLALAYAISRKESAFAVDARSPVGALGLMQVMPATGRQVAGGLGLAAPNEAALIGADLNLQLGNAYLAQMLKRFNGNLIMAAASYNAGPGRVVGWRKDNQGQDAAIWIENITYGETRDYVKSILAFRAVYDWHLGGESRRLARDMPTMPGPNDRGPAYALRDE